LIDPTGWGYIHHMGGLNPLEMLQDDITSNASLTTPLEELETYVSLGELQPYLSETSIENMQALVARGI